MWLLNRVRFPLIPPAELNSGSNNQVRGNNKAGVQRATACHQQKEEESRGAARCYGGKYCSHSSHLLKPKTPILQRFILPWEALSSQDFAKTKGNAIFFQHHPCLPPGTPGVLALSVSSSRICHHLSLASVPPSAACTVLPSHALLWDSGLRSAFPTEREHPEGRALV